MYPPGESPFRARGSTYLAVHAYAEAKIQGGMAAVSAALPEGPHRDFAAQTFRKDDWYDALPLRPITETIANLEGVGWEDSVRAHAEYQAQRQLGVLGRIRVRSPEQAVDKLGREGLENFDFGKSELSEAGPGQARLAYHGVPQPLGSWMLAMVRGHGSVLLNRAGGKNVGVSGRLIPSGRREDVALVEVRIDLTWTS